MSAATVFGLCGAAAVGLGLYGLIANPQPLRKILAFNLLGSGVFLFFGVVARRGAAAGFGGDPVPQALVITGIVVAFAATALAIALLLRLFQATGSATLSDDTPAGVGNDRAAALASEASGQRGDSMVRAHSASEDARERADDTRPEPGSSARDA
jgi:multicomponent Na+:H+ antiporter subunit C